MSRLANLPIAARLGAAIRPPRSRACWPITLTAVQAFGTFRDDTQKLADRDVRAVAVAGELGQDVQGVGREAVEHLYVYDGDLASQDEIAGRRRGDASSRPRPRSAELDQAAPPAPRRPRRPPRSRTASTAWSAKVTEAVKRSRQETVDNVEERDGSRTLYVEEISGETGSARRRRSSRCRPPSTSGTAATAAAVAARAGSTSKLLLIVHGRSRC